MSSPSPQVHRTPRVGPALSDPNELERFLHFLIIAIGTISLAAMGIGLASGDGRDVVIGVSGVSLSGVCLLLFRLGLARGAAWCATLGALVIGVLIVATGNGVRDLGMLVFPFVILMSQMLLRQREANWVTALIVATAGLVASAEATGLLRIHANLDTRANEVSFVILLVGAIAIVVRALVAGLHRTLERALVHEQNYREVFNAATEAILVHDAENGIILDVNDSACAMSGMTREELLTLDARAFDVGSDYSGERALALIRATVTEGPQVVEWHALRKDGSRVWLEIGLRAAVIQGKTRVLSVLRDVDERKRMQERLQESEKLEAVGRLAGGVAHDFNNQLTAILASATLLRDGVDAEKTRRLVDTIIRCSERSAQLTGQLLAFARKAKHQSVAVDVNSLVEDVAGLLERSIDKRIRIELSLSEKMAAVLGDPTLLSSAVLNLGVNARDAMPEGGTIRFETSLVTLGDQRDARAGLSPGSYVRLVVSDTGVGMDVPTRARLFEPFFTTKPNGNGMGLPAVYGTIESHNGAIFVESAPGEGTEFEILLPSTSLSARGSTMPSAAHPAFHGLRVLLGEDEPDVAMATTTALEQLGCTVTVCKDGHELVEHFVAQSDAFDVLIVDQVMPRASGRDAVQAIRSERPDARVLVISGYMESEAGGVPDGADGFLPKPFGIDALAKALQMLRR